jgi:DNA polymerase III sliding clamp (beta) subunit (PCNA family)
MVTTDGHRMFVARLAERPAADVIVPYADVAAALKLAGARCKDIEIDLAATRIGQIQFTPIDGAFPDWRRVVPTGEETPSNKPGANDGAEHVHFNHAYIGDLAKMAVILCGKADTAQSMLHPVSASHPCLVTFGERADCFAVIMPVRRTIDRSAVLTRNVVMAG